MQKIMDFLHQTFLLILGNALCAMAVTTILIPHEFLSGGLTGVALILYYKNQVLPVGLLYLIVNIPMFVLGFRMVGLRFILYTGWGMLIFAALLFVPLPPVPLADKMLAAIVAGIIGGAGSAIMFRSHGAPGGSEIISVICFKYLGISVGTTAVIINALILAAGIFVFPFEDIIYTLIYIVISAKVTDVIFHGLLKRQAVMIVSSKWKQIIDEINTHTRLGATLLQGKGSFSGVENPIIYSIVNRPDVVLLKKMAMRTDPSAFIAIMEASDVVAEDVGNQPHW